jgi:hypothetical protein
MAVFHSSRATLLKLWEGAMQGYINHENILRYKKLIAASEADPHRDEARHRTLVQLLTEEQAKRIRPDDWPDTV